jgi:FecR protein
MLTLKSSRVIGLGFVVLILWVTVTIAQPLQVRVDRWLEIRQISGTVTYQSGSNSQAAQVGMRLQSVGDGITTAARSQAVLGVDTGIGFVEISESTVLRIQQLELLPDGGRVTRMQVPRGQAHVRVRQFTHPSSELEIQTPAGWSAVRGTDFGVTAQPDGKMGVATREGSVVTIAQGVTVPVRAGFQNLTIPGEPPSPPVPISTDPPRLILQRLAAVSNTAARVVGRIDPVNLLIISDIPQVVDPDGRFDVTATLSQDRQIDAVVITPLGERQTYELAVP